MALTHAPAHTTSHPDRFVDEEPLLTENSSELDPLESGGPHLVRWMVDGSENVSPAQAAADVWRDNFGRGPDRPGPDDACVFTVIDRATGRSVEIDLSEERFAHLFA